MAWNQDSGVQARQGASGCAPVPDFPRRRGRRSLGQCPKGSCAFGSCAGRGFFLRYFRGAGENREHVPRQPENQPRGQREPGMGSRRPGPGDYPGVQPAGGYRQHRSVHPGVRFRGILGRGGSFLQPIPPGIPRGTGKPHPKSPPYPPGRGAAGRYRSHHPSR